MKADETQEILKKLNRIERLLKSNTELAMSFNKAVRYTGLSKSHLYKLTSSRAIQFYKPNGKLIYFKKSELDKFLLSNKISTRKEIEQNTVEILSKLKR